MSGLACARCFKFMRTTKIGVYIEEGMPYADGTWHPYKLWMADLCECPECGARMVTRFGRGPIAEHYQPHYREVVEAVSPIGRVDDCGGRKP